MDKVIVEIKATKEGISNEYITQTLNYQKISGCKTWFDNKLWKIFS